MSVAGGAATVALLSGLLSVLSGLLPGLLSEHACNNVRNDCVSRRLPVAGTARQVFGSNGAFRLNL